jgi:hypothetical protein
MTRKRERALRQRDAWLEKLRHDAARWSGELQAQLLLAEAECRSLHPAECLAAATRAQTIAPQDDRAMMWKGLAMVEQSALLPASQRAAVLASARDLIVKANQVDQEAIGPLMAYYQSYAETGETPSAAAIDGVQKAMEEVPAAPATRLVLANALVGRGEYKVARPVILPVAIGAYDTPETPAAKALLARIDAAATAQGQPGADARPSAADGGNAAEPQASAAAHQ